MLAWRIVRLARGLEHALHPGTISSLVGLGAAGAHGRTLARVEEAELDAGFVDRDTHLAAQRVDFAHQMALADTADGGIAGHLADVVEIEREHQSARTHPGSGKRCFDAGVAGADHDHVVSGGGTHSVSKRSIMTRRVGSRKSSKR